MTARKGAAPVTVDEYIGYLVRLALWRSRRTQAQLALELGVSQAAVSRRLVGKVAWRVSDVMAAAALCGVDWTTLVQRPAGERAA